MTASWQRCSGPTTGAPGDGWLAEGHPQKILREHLFDPTGAVITSRKVFDEAGGWGEAGFYRMPVYVLTYRPHQVIVKGETTFTFVTEGIAHAIALAAAGAGDKKVHVMGGASVIQQVLSAGLADELLLHVAPVLLGSGTALFEHVGGPVQPERTTVVESRFATHLRFRVVKQAA